MVYQSIKDFGKKAFLISRLVAVLSGCEEKRNINQVFSDINLDGRKDLVEYIYESGIHITLNKSDGIFAARPTYILRLRSRPEEFRVDDLDRDKIPDISYVVESAFGWGSIGGYDLYLAKGNNDGTFQSPVKIKHYKTQ
ncbi:MAG: VCBS repeat-containing protein [Nanoarchaeota archaeon]